MNYGYGMGRCAPCEEGFGRIRQLERVRYAPGRSVRTQAYADGGAKTQYYNYAKNPHYNHDTYRPLGLGAIVMEPLKGGLRGGLGEGSVDMVARAGAAAPAALMTGAAISYGAIGGIAGRSWRTAGTSALLGSGLVGVMSGIGLMGVSAVAPSMPTGDPSVDAGVEGLRSLAGPGAGYLLVGGALLAWGGWRAYKKR